MDVRSGELQSQLETDMQQNELCLLTGETTSLYVDDVSIASLPNGYFCFFFFYFHKVIVMASERDEMFSC